MINTSISVFFLFFFKFVLLVNVFLVVCSVVVLTLNNFFGNIAPVKDKTISNVLKNLLIFTLLINIFLMSLVLYVMLYFYKLNYFSLLLNDTKFNVLDTHYCIYFYSFDFDLFNTIFYVLALFVAFISLLALDTRLYSSKSIFLVLCNVLILVIFMFSFTTNFILFFIFYELLLIPSFFFVYRISPAKTSVQSSVYFVMWTQIGSFLVFLAILFCVVLTNSYSFNSLSTFNFTPAEIAVIQYLLFFGFGIKIPVWPFHYWITKTHVDAPTGFSIFLSGFLVKTALFGFYKFNMVLGFYSNNVLFSTICLIGVVDASMKMWGQTDLKKLVAYATIQEMGIVYITMCFGDTTSVVGGFIFSVTHALLSAIFFFLVDAVSRRFYTRNIVEINGILHLAPNLGVVILMSCIFYSGLPGTLKFISELYIFGGMLDITPGSTVVVLFGANFFGLIGFSKVWFNVVFGMTPIGHKYMIHDLSFKELYTLSLCYLILVLWGLILPNFL